MTACLVRLWNKVWATGSLPENWKLEHRMLLAKPGKESYNDCSAYRTVSMTDILGKRLEKNVVKHLIRVLDGNAVVKSHSTKV